MVTAQVVWLLAEICGCEVEQSQRCLRGLGSLFAMQNTSMQQLSGLLNAAAITHAHILWHLLAATVSRQGASGIVNAYTRASAV